MIGNAAQYRWQTEWLKLPWRSEAFCAEYGHYGNGPTLRIKCRDFDADSEYRTTVWGKTKRGWHALLTQAVAIEHEPTLTQIDRYVRKNVEHAIDEAFWGRTFKQFMSSRRRDSATTALRLAGLIWTATQLLMKGWQDPAAPEITSPPFTGTRPAPRVVQHQLDALLEAFVYKTEAKFLTTLLTAIAKGTEWPHIASAVCVYQASLERDIWRLMYWMRHDGVCRHTAHSVDDEYLYNLWLTFGRSTSGGTPRQQQT